MNRFQFLKNLFVGATATVAAASVARSSDKPVAQFGTNDASKDRQAERTGPLPQGYIAVITVCYDTVGDSGEYISKGERRTLSFHFTWEKAKDYLTYWKVKMESGVGQYKRIRNAKLSLNMEKTNRKTKRPHSEIPDVIAILD